MTGAAADRGALFRLVERLPSAAVGLDSDLRIAFANERARMLLGAGHVAVGTSLPDSFGTVARRLVDGFVIENELVESEGRSFQITGAPPGDDDPAVIFVREAPLVDAQVRVMQEFVRNAAHQLRTPLTAITAAVEVLQAGAKDDEAERERFLAHLEGHTARLTRVARGLLLLARAQSGEELRLGPVEIKPLLKQLVEETVTGRGVVIGSSCPPGLAALADRDLLHEALAALVDNAADHTVAGSVRLSAAAARSDVEIVVADTGPGIPAGERARVFEPFFTTTGGSERFGLGLAVTAQAVKTMRGSVRIDDTPKGTTFVVRIPAAAR